MRTLAHQKQTVQVRTHRKLELFSEEKWKQIEMFRFGIGPMILIAIACIGGLCAAFGAKDSAFQLGLTVFPTIICLGLIISVAPMKYVVYLGIAAVIIDLAVYLF
jgi:hypothetical protein